LPGIRSYFQKFGIQNRRFFERIVEKMLKKFIKWFTKLFGVSFEPHFEIVDNIDVFVKDKLNSTLDGAKSFDIATGYFQISGWKSFADALKDLLKNGGKIRLLIGDVSRENLLPQTAKFLLHLTSYRDTILIFSSHPGNQSPWGRVLTFDIGSFDNESKL